VVRDLLVLGLWPGKSLCFLVPSEWPSLCAQRLYKLMSAVTAPCSPFLNPQFRCFTSRWFVQPVVEGMHLFSWGAVASGVTITPILVWFPRLGA
jgi:hypothetical protein